MMLLNVSLGREGTVDFVGACNMALSLPVWRQNTSVTPVHEALI